MSLVKIPTIADFTDFRHYLQEYILCQPRRGHGFKLKIAEALNVHPTLITQILNDKKSFSMEQAYHLCQFLKLNDLEKDYFLTLVEIDRAGDHQLKKFLQLKIKKMQNEFSQTKTRVQNYTALSESDQALFYSQWYYSAMRLTCGLNQKNTRQSLSENLNLPINLTNQVINFLVAKNLVIEMPDGRLDRGPQNTFITADSPLISRHHMNWRMKAMENHPRLTDDELAFSAPMTLAEKDLPEIKKMCQELIQQISQKISNSPSEVLTCLNIDWFRLSKKE